jgi:hypothetical protein
MIKQRLVVLTLGLFLSCADERPDDLNETSRHGFHGTWKVVAFIDLSNNKPIRDTPDNTFDLGRDIIITFDDSKAPHSFEGRNTTNSISGTFEFLNCDGKEFTEVGTQDCVDIPGYASTYVAQPEWGRLFDVHFNGIMRYQITGSHLTFFNDKNFSIEFERQ